MSEGGKVRSHAAEFRVEIAQRMEAGENVMALSRQYKLARSMMYRWRDAYRRHGPGGLVRSPGKPAGRVVPAAAPGSDERLRQRIAELERKVGQQSLEIDFFKGVFRRLGDLPKAPRRGSEASTKRSSE